MLRMFEPLIPLVGIDRDRRMRLGIIGRGKEMIVAWPGEDRVFYRESGPDGWSDRFELRLGSRGIDSFEQAYELLRLRAEGR